MQSLSASCVFETLPAAELSSHGDVLARIRAGSLTGVVVRGLYPQERIAEVLHRFDREDVPATMLSPFFPGRAWGRPLTVETDIDAYLTVGATLRTQMAAVFASAGCEDFQAVLERTVSTLGGGDRVRPGMHPDGRAFIPFTLREMRPGGQISAHYEDEAFQMPSMQSWVRPLVSEPHQLSAYLMVQRAERGGDLRVFDLTSDDPRTSAIQKLPRDGEQCVRALEAASPYHVPDTWPGDLIVFDAGRRWHFVTQVEGRRSRWTMGMFFAPAVDGGWVYWA